MAEPDSEDIRNKCKYCSKAFSVASNLNRHIRRVHEEKDCPVEKNVSCDECHLLFRDHHQLKVHQRTHTKEKPFYCSQCSFRAGRKEDVKRHMKSCRGPKYKCNNCGKEFKSKKDVNHHHVWDPICGTFGDEPSDKKFVKIAVNSELSVIGVNCQDLIDDNILEKRPRKVRCGICYNCSAETDCGSCVNCLQNKVCTRRNCLIPVDCYNIKKNQDPSDLLKKVENNQELRVVSMNESIDVVLDNPVLENIQMEILDLEGDNTVTCLTLNENVLQ